MTALNDVRIMDDPDKLDLPSLADPELDSSPYVCESCGVTIPPTPTGRKPRVMLCDEHKNPRNATGKTTSRPASRAHGKIKDGMTGVHAMLSFGVRSLKFATVDDVWVEDGNILASHADRLGNAWADACATNPKLEKQVLKFLDAAGTLSLLSAYAPVAYAITANHISVAKKKPDNVVTPDFTRDAAPASPFPHP